MPDLCGYAVIDADGEEQPCDRPATSWRWYQDVEHEDCLASACDWHENEGGRRMHHLQETLDRVESLAGAYEAEIDRLNALRGLVIGQQWDRDMKVRNLQRAAQQIRSALAGPEGPEQLDRTG